MNKILDFISLSLRKKGKKAIRIKMIGIAASKPYDDVVSVKLEFWAIGRGCDSFIENLFALYGKEGNQ